MVICTFCGVSAFNWSLKPKGEIPDSLKPRGIVHCLQPPCDSISSFFALDHVAFSSTRHRSQAPDNHKRQDSKSYVKDFFNWTSALTGVTVQLFSRSVWQSTWKRFFSRGDSSKQGLPSPSRFQHTIVLGWWQSSIRGK